MRGLAEPALPGLLFALVLPHAAARLAIENAAAFTLGLMPLLLPITAAAYAHRRIIEVHLQGRPAPFHGTWFLIYPTAAAGWCAAFLHTQAPPIP